LWLLKIKDSGEESLLGFLVKLVLIGWFILGQPFQTKNAMIHTGCATATIIREQKSCIEIVLKWGLSMNKIRFLPY
jgi:hypothetical protein